MGLKKKSADFDGWKIVAACFISYVTIYIGRKNFSACMPNMISDGVIDKTLGGTIGTGFLLCYAIGQFISGYLGDRISPKFMVSIGLTGAGIINVVMGINSIPLLFVPVWSMCGLFCSMLWPSIIRAISSWTSEKVSISAGASLSAAIPLGSILSYVVCAVCLETIGWRGAFLTSGIILIIVGILEFVSFNSSGILGNIIKDADAKLQAEQQETIAASGKEPDKKSLLTLFLTTGLMFTVGGIVFNGILKDGLDLWLPTYLGDIYISDAAAVSFICTALPVVNIIGVYIAKFIYSKFIRSEMMTSALMFAISAVSLGGVLLITMHAENAENVSIIETILAVFLLALTSATMLGANTMFLTFIPFKFSKIGRASSVTGTLDAISYAAAAISGVTIGTIAQNYGWLCTFISFIVVSLSGAVICFFGSKRMHFDN